MDRKTALIVALVVFLFVYPTFCYTFQSEPQKDTGKTVEGKVILKSEGQVPNGINQKTGASDKVSYIIHRETLLAGKVPIQGYENIYLGGLVVLPDYVCGHNFRELHIHRTALYFPILLIICLLSLKTGKIYLKKER